MALSLLIGLGLLATVTPPAPSTPPPPPACTASEHRQFDFWVGDWVVQHPQTGAEQGRNSITRESGGCALHEHWRGGRGFEGHSLNAYDRQRGKWMQVWVGADGTVLRLEGGLRKGAMVLEGEQPRADGGIQRQRITWTPAADGSVSQHWQVSDDGGSSWSTSFLGIYRRAGQAQDSGEPASGEGGASAP